MVICCIGFKLDTGLFAFVADSVLILLGCADEKKAIKSIPWGTLVFICGVDYEENGTCPRIFDTCGFRTANLLLDGIAHLN